MHAESIDPATQIFERTADAEHASMTDKPTRELHSVKNVHLSTFGPSVHRSCLVLQGKVRWRTVSGEARPSAQKTETEAARPCGACEHLGRLLQIASAQHSQWKGQNEAFIVLLVGWCAICLNAVKMAPLLRRKMVKHSNIAAAKVPCMHSGSASLATHGFLGSTRAFPRKLIIARTFCELLVYRSAKLLQYKKK